MTKDAPIAEWPAWLPRRLLDVDEVAHFAHASVRHIRRMIAEGRLAHVRIGRLVRVPPEAVLALISGQQLPGAANNYRKKGKK